MQLFKVTAIFLTIILSACSSKQPQDYTTNTPKQLYQEALIYRDKKPCKALNAIDNIEKYYPASSELELGRMLKIYILYMEGKFDESLDAIDDFQYFYSVSTYTDYVCYMKGIKYYTQIVDIGRDQYITYQAMEEMQKVASSFPNTEYGLDAARKAWYCYNC